MVRFALLFAAGGAGSVCRYLVSRALFHPGSDFPFATLTVNLAGCFAIGVLARWLSDDAMRLVWITGFLGGFTTFSAYGLETLTLVRGGAWGIALCYALLSNAGGLLLAWVGWKIA